MKLPDSFTVTLTDADYQKAVKALRRSVRLRSECCLVSQAVRRTLEVRRVKTTVKHARVADTTYLTGPSLVFIVDWFDTATLIEKPNWPKTLPKRWQKTLTFRKEVA